MDRSLVMATGMGAALGLSWILLGQIGWLLSGVIVPVALIVWVISGRWTEMGALLLLNGAIPLPFLASPALGIGQFEVVTPRLETLTVISAGVALAAAVVFTVLGAAVLLATAMYGRQQARRHRHLPPRRGARRP